MSQSNGAAVLTESALMYLNDALEQAASPADFLAQADAIIEKPENRLPLPTDLGDPDPIRPSGTKGVDIANAPAVFEYIGLQDRSNASDPRLWTFLAFSTYRAYMEERWPLDAKSASWKNRVRDRWLLRSATRGRLIRHGIARLWWVTDLTVDTKCEHPLSKATGDPYAYTTAVFQNEDRINALFDREAGAITSVMRSVLEHADKDSSYQRDSHVRAVMKELTLTMGFRDLGVLSPADLDALIEEVRPRYEGDDDDANSPTARTA